MLDAAAVTTYHARDIKPPRPSGGSHVTGAQPTSHCLDSCGAGSRGVPRWYVAWTHPQRERRASAAITALGYQVYLPLHLTRTKCRHVAIVPLWPRYVLARFDAARDRWGDIAHLPDIGGLIRHGWHSPTPLPDAVVADFISRTSQRGVVDDPQDNPPAIPVGTEVTIPGGIRGIVELSEPERVAVLYTLFQRTLQAELRPDQVEIAAWDKCRKVR